MKKILAFTLAEVLITITIIGVVAAMTIPNLVADINQRKYNSASGNFQRKLGEALKVMNVQNTLSGHESTKDFVTELSKNFKILKVCDTVTDCFPSKFKKSNNDIIEVSTLTDATKLGQSYGTETIGVQFADGIRAVLAYNPQYNKQKNGDVVSFVKDDTNKTVAMKTDVISMIFDVSEDESNKISEDIFLMNTNFGSTGPCDGVKIADYCIKDFKKDYIGIPCLEGLNPNYCGNNPSGVAKDYWAGANMKCAEEGMKLPTLAQLSDIYVYTQKDAYKGLLTVSGSYWTSSENNYTRTCAYYLDFSTGNTNFYYTKETQYGVLCIGN